MGDRYEPGRDLFPSLSDRMHLAVVVAKCGAFCARVEATVKNMLRPDVPQLEERTCWPQDAAAEVERHETNLGLTAPAVQEELSAERETDHDRESGPKHGL